MIQAGLRPNEIVNADLTVQKEAFCNEGSTIYGRTLICVINEKRRDTSACFGDSGGPIICGGKQIGVASHMKGTCGDEKAIPYYTNVYLYREWIQKNAGCRYVFNLFGCCRIISIVLTSLRYV